MSQTHEHPEPYVAANRDIPEITVRALVLGAILSIVMGWANTYLGLYAGMTVATMANARTTEAAKDGPGKALPGAFRGGAVMGFDNASSTSTNRRCAT